MQEVGNCRREPADVHWDERLAKKKKKAVTSENDSDSRFIIEAAVRNASREQTGLHCRTTRGFVHDREHRFQKKFGAGPWPGFLRFGGTKYIFKRARFFYCMFKINFSGHKKTWPALAAVCITLASRIETRPTRWTSIDFQVDKNCLGRMADEMN